MEDCFSTSSMWSHGKMGPSATVMNQGPKFLWRVRTAEIMGSLLTLLIVCIETFEFASFSISLASDWVGPVGVILLT